MMSSRCASLGISKQACPVGSNQLAKEFWAGQWAWWLPPSTMGTLRAGGAVPKGQQ